jgi:type 1 glutamine amidotransferase
MEELRVSSGRDSKTMSHRRIALFFVTGLIVLSACQIGLAKGHVLIYTKNGKGYVHDNIPASVECLKGICTTNGWTYEVTDNAGIFTQEKIKGFDVLVFSNTNNETFDSNDQRQVFQGYIRGGGGFVGIHSACGSERAWPWFWAAIPPPVFCALSGNGKTNATTSTSSIRTSTSCWPLI